MHDDISVVTLKVPAAANPQFEKITLTAPSKIIERHEVTLEDPQLVGVYKISPQQKRRANSPRQVPLECEIYTIPDNIRGYLLKVLPALQSVIAKSAHLALNHPDVAGIVNDFFVYYLGSSKEGIERYRLYEETRIGRPKYHHYTLSMAQNFGLQYRTNQKKQLREVGIQDYDGTDGQMTEPGRIHSSHLESHMELTHTPDNQEDALDRKHVAKCYFRAAEHLQSLQASYRTIDSKCWQAFAYDIFKAMGEEQTLTSLAVDFGISRTSINKWCKNVQQEVRNLLDGNPFN